MTEREAKLVELHKLIATVYERPARLNTLPDQMIDDALRIFGQLAQQNDPTPRFTTPRLFTSGQEPPTPSTQTLTPTHLDADDKQRR